MLDDAKLHYVDSLDEAVAFMQWATDLANRQHPVAFDTETTGLKWWTHPFVRLAQFGTGDESWAVDIERWRGPVEQALRMLIDAGCNFLMWHSPFDMHAIEEDRFPTPSWAQVHDGKIMSALLIPHENHSLKPTAARYFGADAYAGQNSVKALFKRTGTSWHNVDTRHPEYWVYGCMDTVLTYRVVEQLSREIRLHGFTDLYEREMAKREIYYRAERRGLIVDEEWTSTLHGQWTVEAVKIARDLEAAGIKNPGSNKQVTDLLEELGWEPDVFTTTGVVKLDKVILHQIAASRPEWAQVAEPLLRYRRITKWLGTYLRPFLEERDEAGRLHFGIQTLRARTGRDSITEPPMQTLPGKAAGDGSWMIRRCIVPGPGHVFYSCDYASQEAREFAHYSQDPAMLACIRRGDDLYTFAAQLIYNDPSITKAHPLRDITKVNLLAFLYGAGLDKLAQTSGLSLQETEAFIRRLFEVFPNVRDLTGDNAIGGNYPGGPALAAAERGRNEGLRYVLTKSGRRFSVPNDNELYKCVNGLMQGGGMDIISEAVIRLDQLGYGDNIVLPIHDEILFRFPEGEEGQAAAQECATIMEDHTLSVPITTELSQPLDSWGRAYMPKEAAS